LLPLDERLDVYGVLAHAVELGEDLLDELEALLGRGMGRDERER
jgi:hypothetical protein